MFSRRLVAVFVTLLAGAALSALPGCDWLQGSEQGERQSPYLSNLVVSPPTVLCNQTFSVSFRYEDPQGDVERARISLQRTGDTAVREEYPLWPDPVGKTSGAVTFPFTFSCGTKGGIWTVSVQAYDDKDHTSNTLTGRITLNAPG